jgi:hypothetical protein
MRAQQYVVKLNGKERSRLEDLIRKGKSSARVQLRTRILLHADTSKQGSAWNDVQIAEALGTYPIMCARVRRQWVDEGLEAVSLACSPPPAGRSGWTLRLLENKVVELKIVDRPSDNTIGRVLKKTNSSPISRSSGLFHRSKTARS